MADVTKEQAEAAVRATSPDDLVQALLRQLSETFPAFEHGGAKMTEAARRAAAFVGAAWDMRTKLALAISRCSACGGKTSELCAPCKRVFAVLDLLK